ncbi:MAG: beta-ketoacyl-[acyl-carrier-protein] synthase family protein [Alphaproteobacteria bacterium]
MRPIAITGFGVVSALGHDARGFHDALVAGRTAIVPAPWAARLDGRKAWWGLVGDFDPADWMDAKVAEGSDLFAQFALAATAQAVRHAGLDDMDPLRTAIVHGTSIGGVRAVMKAQHALDTAGPQAIPRKTMIQVWPNMAAAQIAMRYRLHGPSITVTTACASALDAIGTAARLIDEGHADVALAGATEGGISAPGGGTEGDFVPVMFYTSTLYGMDAASDDPNRAMLPFDVKRAGIVVGEGAAMLVLERPEHARARGAPILGYLRGYGNCADAHHPSSPDPSGQWEAHAMRLALKDADVAPDDVQALIAHATGTPKGDTAEINAINAVHGGRGLPVASVKGHIGHPGAPGGAMGIMTLLQGMDDGHFLMTANTDQPDPACDFEVVTGQAKPLDYGCAQVNAFGFGGQNASVVVSRD